MGRAEAPALRVEVVYCAAPRQTDRVQLQLPSGATVQDALSASGLVDRHALPVAELRVGLWGRVQPLTAVLRDLDRVELYRPLRVDPKEARRLRYKRAKRAAGA